MTMTSEFVLQVAFPTIGIFTGLFMSFAPYRAVLKASNTGHLGDLNPTPWVFMLGNCAGWIGYSFMIQNWFVFLPNAPSLILAVWLNIQAIKINYGSYRSNELRDTLFEALEEESKKMLDKKKVGKIFDMAIEEDGDII